MKNININEFLSRFNNEYDFLYDNNDNVAGYSEAATAFDDFLVNNNQFVCDFNKYRGDIIISDREAAAFMFALESMGGLNNEGY